MSENMLRGKNMKKIAFVLVIVMIAAVSCSRMKQGEDFATITFFVGEVKKNGVDVQIGDLLKDNDKIVTGNSASCDIRLGESVIRLKEKSVMMVSQLLKKGDQESVALGLDMGKMLCKPKKLMKEESFVVRTPTAVAGVRGTRFIVEADANKTTRIKVYDGKVKVVKRIDKLEQKVGLEAIMEQATPVEESQKVVITQQEVAKAEQKVEQVLQAKAEPGAAINVAAVIQEVKNDVVVEQKSVQQFRPEEFQEERDEIINVQAPPQETMEKIENVVRRERKAPEPDGNLVVTRSEIYFIKNGRVVLERKVMSAPAVREGTIFIAAQDYIFSASVDGPVRWRKKMNNDGKVEIKDDSLYVYSEGQVKRLNLNTGETIP